MTNRTKGHLMRSGTTSDFFAGGVGEGIKLFHDKSPYHAHEVRAATIAHQAGIRTPAVVEGLVEMKGSEAIIFERVEGPTLAEHINSGQANVVACARDMAVLHLDIHARPAPEGTFSSKELMAWAIPQVDCLASKTKETILTIIDALPHGNRICHNDFGPHNIILSETGMVIVDWAGGTSGPPLADCASTAMLATVWMGEVAREASRASWGVFWDTYRDEYRRRCPYSEEELQHWQLGVAAAQLFTGAIPAHRHYRLDFITSVLG